jgi:hypothetical protein
MSSSSSRPEVHIDEKWDRVINVVFTRSMMGLVAGAVGGLLLFRMFSSILPCFTIITLDIVILELLVPHERALVHSRSLAVGHC